MSAAWGYGLFALATALLLAGVAGFAVFAMSRASAQSLAPVSTRLLLAGAWTYLAAVVALAVHYVQETLQGRMQWHWIVFGPAVLAALVVLDVGLYRKLVRNNLPSWRRYRQYLRREDAEPEAMRRAFVDDVLLQRPLWQSSRVRWVRHALIFWGFGLMFAAELAAVFVREGFPAFGWHDIWREPGHPLRQAFDFAFDLTGLMVLAGCLLALAWRVAVNATPDRKYADTPTTVFLLVVVAGGFVLEGWRIAPTLADPAHAASFIGLPVAHALTAAGLAQSTAGYRALWLFHVVAACAFIAYVPLKRMVHTCATPLGRLMNSQKALAAAKRRGVLGAMLLRRNG